MTEPFRRTLTDDITISVDGHSRPDPDVTDRAPTRVVLTMPDYVADSLAHLIAQSRLLTTVLGRQDEIGLDGGALADALYSAALCGDYRCPQGGLYGAPSSEELWP